MKLATRHDINTPLDAVFDILTDTDRWERDALRRGAEVQRMDPPGPVAAGSEWRCRFMLRGRSRDLTLRLTRLDAPQRLDFAGVSRGYDVQVTVDLLTPSPGRTRIITRIDLRATTLTTRILLQSARLAKARLQQRLQSRVAILFAGIEDRHRRAV